MRIAALYDVHGNLPALESVLTAIRNENVEQVIIGGDVVPGPMPKEALALLKNIDLPIQFIAGNGEHDVLACRKGDQIARVPEQFRAVIRWNAEQLSDDEARLMAGWPDNLEANLPGLGKLLFCHATPRSDVEIFTRQSSEKRLQEIFRNVAADVIVCGHTHMPFDRKVDGLRIVNAGSVGMPFAAPGAYWLVIDSNLQLQHTTYNYIDAAERIKSTSYPQAEQFAQHSILQPPSEDRMLEVFSAVDQPD